MSEFNCFHYKLNLPSDQYQSLIIKLVILVVSEVDCFKNRFIVYGLNLQQLGVVNK